jgi:hypothetical protein
MQTPSKLASVDDFEWYHSEGDDQPLARRLPAATTKDSNRTAETAEHSACPRRLLFYLLTIHHYQY